MDRTTEGPAQQDSQSVSPSEMPPDSLRSSPDAPELHDLYWMIVGPNGIRAGWLVLLFYCLFRLLLYLFSGILFAVAPGMSSSDSPFTALSFELVQFCAMLGAGGIMIAVAHRSPADYYLAGSHRMRRFAGGFLVGFAALSGLVGTLKFGGWLHFGHRDLTGSRILQFAVVWGLVFLLVGCVEEGTFRCYGLATLVRGINFWWALAFVAGVCLYAHFFVPGESTLGVQIFAAVGLVPCFLVHFKRVPSSNFWQAAWASSTGFGFVHTFNSGENWIGIFAAAFIGFVFCVSIWVTGSAWWAIGCHAAWDWAETYFYGTADSGFVAPGHLFTTSPTGNPLWSGGSDGPEGSLLILPIVLIMLIWLLIVYRRPRAAQVSAPAPAQQAAG